MSGLTESRTIPITVIGKQVLAGFDRSRFEAALAESESQ